MSTQKQNSPRKSSLVPLEYSLDPHLLPLCGLVFLSVFGRGIGHFSLDPPYRALLWNESLLSPLFEWLPWSWSAYVENLSIEGVLQTIEKSLGALYIGCACFLTGALAYVSLLIHRVSRLQKQSSKQSFTKESSINPDSQNLPPSQRRLTSPPKIIQPIVYTCWMILGLQSFYIICQWQDHLSQVAVLLEGATHLSLPLILLCILPYRRQKRSPYLWVLSALSLTFIGHGLYALNVYPTPGHFLTMTMDLLHITQSQAQSFLYWIGCLDLLCGGFIWMPLGSPFIIRMLSPFLSPPYLKYIKKVPLWTLKFQKYSLFYMGIWGIITACARVGAHWFDGSFLNIIWVWGPEMMYRLPQGGLAIWWIFELESQRKESLSGQILDDKISNKL